MFQVQRHRSRRRNILYNKFGHTVGSNFIHRAHHHTISVGINQMVVDPSTGTGRHFRQRQFTCAQRYLGIFLKMIAVDLNTFKIIIKPDFLQLFIGLYQRPAVPQAHIVNGLLVVPNILVSNILGYRKRFYRDFVQAKSFAGKFDIVDDIGCFLL